MINIELVLHDEVPGKLILTIDSIGVNRIADVYYFAIDHSFMRNEETDEKIILILQNLLHFWKEQITNLLPNNTIYLPFDYSDEYIGCLCVRALSDNDLMISDGWTRDVQGHSILPSNPKSFVITDEQILPNEEFDTCHKSELIVDIDRTLLQLGQQLKDSRS